MKKVLSIICTILIVFSSFTMGIGFAMDPPKKNSNCEVKENNEIAGDIDLVYKYIDLCDKNLKREGIPQIKKDYDNDELKYSLRSVIQNVPWVRKIFIIMPKNFYNYA